MPARILVVDDEEVVCRAVARILDGKGHAVETVTDGTEGLRRVETGAYDLVIAAGVERFHAMNSI